MPFAQLVDAIAQAVGRLTGTEDRSGSVDYLKRKMIKAIKAGKQKDLEKILNDPIVGSIHAEIAAVEKKAFPVVFDMAKLYLYQLGTHRRITVNANYLCGCGHYFEKPTELSDKLFASDKGYKDFIKHSEPMSCEKCGSSDYEHSAVLVISNYSGTLKSDLREMRLRVKSMRTALRKIFEIILADECNKKRPDEAIALRNYKDIVAVRYILRKGNSREEGAQRCYSFKTTFLSDIIESGAGTLIPGSEDDYLERPKSPAGRAGDTAFERVVISARSGISDLMLPTDIYLGGKKKRDIIAFGASKGVQVIFGDMDDVHFTLNGAVYSEKQNCYSALHYDVNINPSQLAKHKRVHIISGSKFYPVEYAIIPEQTIPVEVQVFPKDIYDEVDNDPTTSPVAYYALRELRFRNRLVRDYGLNPEQVKNVERLIDIISDPKRYSIMKDVLHERLKSWPKAGSEIR